MTTGNATLRAEAGRLALLFHHGWAPAVLAEMHRGGGGARVVALVHRLGAARDSVRRTLEGLDGRGLVRRNPGYGHPLRPEWILTAAGERIAPRCAPLLRGVEGAGLGDVARRKWTFPVLLALLEGRERFSTLGLAIPDLTPRALAQALRALEGAGAVRREILDARPPRVVYGVPDSVRPIAPALHALAAVSPGS